MNQTVEHTKHSNNGGCYRCRIKCSDLFIIAFCIYSVTLLVESTTVIVALPKIVTLMFKGVRYFSYALCILKAIIMARYKNKQIIYACLLVSVVAITFYTSDRTLAMLTFIFVGAIDVPKDRVIKCLLVIQIVALSITVVGSLLGFIDNYLFDAFRGRWGLGFIWTTFAPILFMFITFEYLYLYNKRMNLFQFMMFGLLATFFYIETKTRLAYAVTLFFVVLSMIEHYKKKPWKFIRRMGKWNVLWPLFFAAIAIILQVSYKSDSEIWQRFDLLLSRRLYYGVNAITKYAITPFGQKIEWVGRSYNTELQGLVPSNDLIDNAYFRNLFLYGVVGLTAILSLYCIGIWKAVREKDFFLVWVYIVILGFCMFEFWMYNLQFNPFALVSVMNFTHKKEGFSMDPNRILQNRARPDSMYI